MKNKSKNKHTLVKNLDTYGEDGLAGWGCSTPIRGCSILVISGDFFVEPPSTLNRLEKLIVTKLGLAALRKKMKDLFAENILILAPFFSLITNVEVSRFRIMCEL